MSMGYKALTAVVGIVMLMAFNGCGGSSSTHPRAATALADTSTVPFSTSGTVSTAAASSEKATPREHKEKVPDIDLPVKLLVPKAPIPARYTCDGSNVSPPISWSRVPADTVEIDLFVTHFSKGAEYTDWAVAGLKPTLRKLSSGSLPSGAVVGRNSFGQARYSVCPSKGPKSSYFVLLIPLPSKIPAAAGFNGPALSAKAVSVASHDGQLSFEYQRRP